jgi:hypothetical protein
MAEQHSGLILGSGLNPQDYDASTETQADFPRRLGYAARMRLCGFDRHGVLKS